MLITMCRLWLVTILVTTACLQRSLPSLHGAVPDGQRGHFRLIPESSTYLASGVVSHMLLIISFAWKNSTATPYRSSEIFLWNDRSNISNIFNMAVLTVSFPRSNLQEIRQRRCNTLLPHVRWLARLPQQMRNRCPAGIHCIPIAMRIYGTLTADSMFHLTTTRQILPALSITL